MNKEDVVELSAYQSQIFRSHAIIFSVVWHLLILFCLFFLIRQQRNLTFNVKRTPLVTFQNPLPPHASTKQARMPQAQQPKPVVSAQQQTLQHQLQQTARQTDSFVPNQEELNYLVQQLISHGSGVTGAVVSAVDDTPQKDSTDEPASYSSDESKPLSTEKEQKQSEELDVAKKTKQSIPQETIEQEETTESTNQSADDSTANSDSLSAQEQQSDQEKPISVHDAAIIKETMASLSTVDSQYNANSQQSSTKTLTSTMHQSDNAHTAPRSHQTRAAAQKPKQISLSDIANSFMRQVRNERDIKYNYDPQKKNGGAPGVYSPANSSTDGKQLALQMYATKVFSMMQQSAHTFSSLIYANNDFETDSLLEITIDQTGKLLRARLNPPIGERDIEQAVQTIIKRVGLFPPIPKHFNTDTMTLTFPLNIRGSKGFGRYSLAYSVAGHP